MGLFGDLFWSGLEKIGDAKLKYDERKIQREYEEACRRAEERHRQHEEKLERDRQRAEERRERERERAEREKAMRLSTLKSDTESAARELSNYKSSTVNPQLSSQTLKAQNAMRVSEAEMTNDVNSRINRQIEHDEVCDTSALKNELALVDDLLRKISQIEQGNAA